MSLISRCRILGVECYLVSVLCGHAVMGEAISQPTSQPANQPTYTFVIAAANHDYAEVPVSATVTAPPQGAVPVLCQGDPQQPVPCQAETLGEQVRIWWIVRNLKRGEAQTFQLTFAEAAAGSEAVGNGRRAVPSAVEVKEIEGGAEVSLDGQLFTRYLTAAGPKPICYPLIGPTGQPITRHFPMEQVAGEPQDHPHHRSLWFTQDEVNGVNFWGEGGGCGRQVHQAFEALEGGPVFGLIRTRNDWVKPDGARVLEDTREVRVYRVADGRLFDFDVTLRATDGPVEFGDTKEGTFGLRLVPTMQLTGGGGHIENARGQKDGDTWGKPAEWCDYYGPVEGEVVGVAILNHPTSFRHPTYWHVRDYGLFAANPFGLRHFIGDKTGQGKYTLAQGEAITFRYRVFLHRGDTASAHVADVYAAYAEPPEVRGQ